MSKSRYLQALPFGFMFSDQITKYITLKTNHFRLNIVVSCVVTIYRISFGNQYSNFYLTIIQLNLLGNEWWNVWNFYLPLFTLPRSIIYYFFLKKNYSNFICSLTRHIGSGINTFGGSHPVSFCTIMYEPNVLSDGEMWFGQPLRTHLSFTSAKRRDENHPTMKNSNNKQSYEERGGCVSRPQWHIPEST